MEKSILIVEDCAIFRRLVSKILKKANFCVLEAENACAALNLLSVLHPDLIVCDIDMPAINGFEVLKALRQKPGIEGTPVIIFSGESDEKYQRLAFKLGANAYLVKPVTSDVLLTAIAEQFGLGDELA
jgi:CheY-like chemotaxis protein